jgi:hypothetical protein
MYARGVGQISDAVSATNCMAGGGSYDPSTGNCNAPAGGALYTDQLAALTAADCPWYCMPYLTYPSTSPCSNCQTTSLASPGGGLPAWAWLAGAGLFAVLLLPPILRAFK